MPNSWSYLVELQKNKPGTLAKIIKHNAPKYIKEEINRLIKEGKIKNIYICGRCFRELAKTMGFKVLGE